MATAVNKDDDSDSEWSTMRIEAEEAIKEIKFAVAFAELSTKLSRSDDLVYINLQTKEGETFCVELCIQGFRVSLYIKDDIGLYCMYKNIYYKVTWILAKVEVILSGFHGL